MVTSWDPVGNRYRLSGYLASSKTYADRNIRADTIHISKFMELGRAWERTRRQASRTQQPVTM
jgi:hypothetical protein